MSLSLFVLVFCVGGLIVGTINRIVIWRQGKSSKQRLPMRLLLTIPKRYFVDLHHIVMENSSMAYTHIFVAGGVVAAGGLLLVGAVIALPWLVWLAVAAVISVGAVRLLLRRRGRPIALSYGSFTNIPRYLLSFALGLVLLFSEFNFWLPYVGVLFAVIGGWVIFWSGKLDKPLKHMISGAVHLAFHPRQGRFFSQREVALSNTEHGLNGVAIIEDFTWNRILSFDACIECGRCQEQCPAFASGQPLNPKKLIQDLLQAALPQPTAAYSGANHPNLAVAATQGQLIAAETLFACTTCRACVEACPMMIEHVDAVVDMRRNAVANTGALPTNAASALQQLRYSDSVDGYGAAARHNWAVDLSIEFATVGTQYDAILLAGEAGFDLRNQNRLRNLVQLATAAGVRLALLANEGDSGDTARRLGDERLFQQKARALMATLDQYSYTTLLTCDPHILNVIRNEYCALTDTPLPIQHHSAFLLALIQQKKLSVAPLNQTMTYHDPCYLGRYNGEFAAPRELLQALGVDVQEMQRSQKKSRCCGWGGGAVFSDIPGKQRIPDMRMDDVRATNTNCVAVACPNCSIMLEGVVEPRPQVIDIVDLTYQAAIFP